MQMTRLAALAAVTAAVAVSGLIALSAAAMPTPAPGAAIGDRGPLCVTTGGLPGLSAAQAANARTIHATALARGGSSAAYVALMTALAESNLLVLSNPNDPSSSGIPAQGVGYDHDSIGLFQQRPPWGTAAQRMDPVTSTNLFLDALIAVEGWSSMEPWRAAQRVQRSAFTGVPSRVNHGSAVYGGNYLAQAPRAARLLTAIETGGPLDCGAAGLTGPAPMSGPVVADVAGLQRLGASQAGAVAASFALAQRGKPYVWGGEGPDGYDCSGLMQTAWARAGVSISRVSSTQFRDGTPTTPDRLVPGDLVLIPGAFGTLARPFHVGMYVGNGKVVHAPRTGEVVKVTTLSSFISDGVSGYRHIR
ncbi:C40 family peptidase [Intrasporangium calvum]|uniref:NLP/P60 protein n=1 Tax=Intrasporangium calvum (strain ATCC 23552 / DSM 43043 / JCM 3097 / NBRC 12989 / NCIMB 10167 / NRRL B-3866 / 7 KIP) TaxID=710696 RepID=E6SCI7_INTC7|nr:C40 family peptidase [Intrasporangium calvum]ADU49591.1 NLP/P60 protein [Intrasporangium calvum DSM 43043]